jgi:Raf kinase inhibitor-like YbhB/YbcL family protein/uncharacterized protein (TIGR00297 family)
MRMLSPLVQLLAGLLAAAAIALLAYFSHALSKSGALAACLLGTVIFGLGGTAWAVLLLAFFISSSLLSRFSKKRKAALNEKFSKGSQRDFIQVAANGGIAGLCVLVSLLFPRSSLPWFAFAATLAAVNADTWATELGVLSRAQPRLISTGALVERGTSGGVSWFGTLFAALGAGFIALPAVLLWPGGMFSNGIWAVLLWFFGITLAGLAGSLVDSLLGATLQVIYTCPACQKETERHPLHTCSTPTTQIRGLAWLNNDWVNTICAFSGALLALLTGLVFTFTGYFSTGSFRMGEITMSDFSVTSTAFQQAQPIPFGYSCEGVNLSPALTWEALPGDTRSVVLIMDDPDAPVGLFVHWVLYNLPPQVTGLVEGAGSGVPALGTAGKNSYSRNRYDGPCPPPGKAHRYFFTVYATDLEPDLPEGLTAAQLRAKIAGHILAQSSLMGLYQR